MPKVKSSSAQIVLRDSYETANRIFNHSSEEGESDPLALVRLHWSEDTVTGSRLHERMKQFALGNVGKVFNMSFTEFINQPTYVIELMLEVCADENVRKNEAAQSALDALETK